MLFNIILCLVIVIISNNSLSTLIIDIRNTTTVDFRNNSKKDLCKTSNELCHVKIKSQNYKI